MEVPALAGAFRYHALALLRPSIDDQPASRRDSSVRDMHPVQVQGLSEPGLSLRDSRQPKKERAEGQTICARACCPLNSALGSPVKERVEDSFKIYAETTVKTASSRIIDVSVCSALL